MLAGIFRVDQLGRATIVAVGLVLALGGSALAGPVADNAAEAEQQAAAGNGAAAIGAFDAAVDAFWQAEPLTFRVARFADQISGFGMYTPRADGPFRAGDTVNIYLEPVGYGFAADGDGYRVSYGTGVEIRTPGGLILGKTDDFGKATWQGRAKSHEVHAAVSVTLPGELKPGDYELLLTLTDDASGKSATATFPFAIAE